MNKFTDGISGRQYTESREYVNIADYLRNNTTPFNEKKTTEKTQQLILNANIPLSELRDKITETNGGSVTKEGAEYRLRASSTNNSVAGLQSLQRGNYVAGNVLEAGQGFRIPTQPTGDAEIDIGYWKGDIGMFLRYDSEDIWLVVENSEGDPIMKKKQADWNLDTLEGLDGNTKNPSGAELDLSNGLVFQIPFVYYGYGPIVFEVGVKQPNGKYLLFPVHSFNRDGQISVDEPNLPLNAEVRSGTSGQQLDLFVGGRQISTYGNTSPIGRPVGSWRLNQSVDGTFTPMVSFQHKTGWENILVELRKLSIISDLDLIWQIRYGGSLTGANWTDAKNYTTTETATEWDIEATDSSGGHIIQSDLAEGGNKYTLTKSELYPKSIYEEYMVTVEARTRTAQTATVTTHFENEEGW